MRHESTGQFVTSASESGVTGFVVDTEPIEDEAVGPVLLTRA